MTVNIKTLPAYQGDAILISLNDGNNCIMIDTGTKKSYTKGIIKNELKTLSSIDLLVLTNNSAYSIFYKGEHI